MLYNAIVNKRCYVFKIFESYVRYLMVVKSTNSVAILRLVSLAVLFFSIALSSCAKKPDLVRWQEKAREAYINKQYKEAVNYYEKALALKPNSSKINYNLGITYLKFKLFDKAAPYFAKAVEFERNDSRKNLGLARLRSVQK